MNKKPTKQELIDHVESLVAKCEELTRERDEARRKCCEALADAYEQSLNDDDGGFFGGEDENWTPQRFAKDEGWDSFKENTDV